MLRYYKGRWPDEVVPADEPLWLFYEVDVEADSVTRSADIFQDSRIERNSVSLEERNGASCPSLVDGPFLASAAEDLDEISDAEFEDVWQRGTDKPFWFP